MQKKRLYLLPVSILILSILACNVPSAGTPTPGFTSAETAAAQTVAAQLSATPSIGTATATDTPVPTTTTAPTNTTVPSATQVCDSAEFISETIPDGTIEPASASFTKTWRLKNIGACTWTSSYATVFVSGNVMNAPAAVPFGGNVAPGQEVDVVVNMQAPALPGNYTGNWELRNASGVLFGLGAGNGPFWIKIKVPASTATPTQTPLPGPTPAVQQVFTQVTASAGGIGHVVVNCPSGSVVTGGGFAGSPSLLVYSDSATGNGWEVDAQNTSGANQLLNSYAICLSNTSGSTQQVFAQVTVAGSDTGSAVVACPSGSVVTGGGFAGNSNLLVYNTSMSGNGWQADAKNISGSNQLLNAYAICLSGTSGSIQQVYAQVSVPNGAVGHAIKACPAGTYLTGGGFATGGTLPYTDSATGTSWEVYIQNNSGASQLVNSYAMCLTLP